MQDKKEKTPLDEPMQTDDSQRQIDERWLQQIEDDPGGLLRRKFLYQYRQHYQTEQDGSRS